MDGQNWCKEPLLDKTFCIEESTKSPQSFIEYWRQKCFSNDSNSHSINVLQLFRFADRVDFLLMSIGFCGALIYAICLSIDLIILSKLFTIFTAFYLENKEISHLNHTSNVTNNIYKCPWGIDLNVNNLNRFSRFCQSLLTRTTTLPLLTTPTIANLRHDVMKNIYAILILNTIMFFGSFTCQMSYPKAAERQVARLRKLVFRSLLQRKIACFDDHHTHQLSVNLLDNVEIIERGLGTQLVIVICEPLCSFISLITAFWIHWELTSMLLCVFPFLCGGLYIFSMVIAKCTNSEMESYARAGQIVDEVIGSIRTVLSFNGIKFEAQRYEKEVRQTQSIIVQKGGILGLFIGWASFIFYCTYFLGFFFVSHHLIIGRCTMVDKSHLFAVVLLVADAIVALTNAAPCFQSFSEALGAAVHVFTAIDDAQLSSINEEDIWKDDDDDLKRKSFEESTEDIEFSDVSFSYPTRQEILATKNLTFTARQNHTTAIIGHSGSGKSTIVSLLLRFYEPVSGRITIGGRSIGDYSIKQLRNRIGVVSQEPILFNTSIAENIRYGKLNATQDDIEEAARQANAHDFIMQLPNKYETLVGENGSQLSGGEKQRVALARTLIKQPSILLLDEPTSALDYQNELLVQEALDRACRTRTTIIITHRLKTIRNVDYIIVLDHGCLIEEGTHHDLMQKQHGIYKQMFELQQKEEIYDEKETQEEKHVQDLSIDRRERTIVNTQKSNEIDERSLFWRLLRMNSPEWKMIVFGCLMSALCGASQLFAFLFLPQIIRGYLNCNDLEENHKATVVSYLLLLIGSLVLVVRFFQFSAFASTGGKLTERLRIKAFACLLRQEIAYFDQPENSSSAFMKRFTYDAQAVQQTMGSQLGTVTEIIAAVIFGLTMGILFNFQLTMIALTYLCIMITLIYLNVQVRKRTRERTDQYLQRAYTIVGQAVHQMRTVKQLTIEKKLYDLFSAETDQTLKIQFYPRLVTAITYSLYLTSYGVIMSVIYIRALALFEQQKLSINRLSMVFAFDMFLVQFLQIFWAKADDLGASLSAAQSFFDVIDRVPSIDNGSNEGLEPALVRGEIELQHVDFAYGSTSILHDLQLKIKPGQRVALVGTSGSGKSTIIQLLERFYDVQHGQLMIDGIDIRQWNIQYLRSCLGLVSQEPSLFNMTIAENITYGKENIPQAEIIQAAIKANVHDFIRTLPEGYETRVGYRGHLLSGGEKQRIAIARTLLRRPTILLLDEATSALDPHNEQMVQCTIEQIHVDHPHQTTLIITHNLSTIRSCDLICVLRKGHIIEMGTHVELMQRDGCYRQMIDQQMI